MAEPRQKDLADLLTTAEDRMRGLEQANTITWDNVRKGKDKACGFSAGIGTIFFDASFPTDCLVVVAWPRQVTNFTWVLNFVDSTAQAFRLKAYQIDPINVVGNVTGSIAVSYIAFGN